MEHMSVHEMKMSVAMDDIRDADMLIGYANRAKTNGDEGAAKQFAENAMHRLDRIMAFCAELKRML